MQKHIFFAVTVSTLLIGVPAFAKGRPAKAVWASESAGREVKEREARKACLEGDYAKGVAVLSDLFLDSKSPVYIFNQGRCYEQSERYQEAIGRFREYLRLPGSEEEALAQKHIAECEALEAKKTPPFLAPVVQPVAQPTGARPVATVQPQSGAAQPQSTSSDAGLRTAGIVIAGVGVAGVVTGLVLNLKANSLAKEIEPPKAFDASKESTRKSYETFSWVGYGVGAAAIATGAIFYGVGLSKGSSDNVAFVPSIGPGLAGAALTGTF